MSTAIQAKAYMYALINALPDLGADVYYGPNSQSQGYVTIEILGIRWDDTSYETIGRGAPFSRNEEYKIAVGIVVKQADGTLEDVELTAKSIYSAIEQAVLADPYMDGLLTGGSLCKPEDLMSGYADVPTAILTFSVDCTARF